MPDLKKKPGEMEFIGGNGGKAAMFKSVKQELTGDDGKSGAELDLWTIGAIIIGLCLAMMLIKMIISIIKKSDKKPKEDNKEDDLNDEQSEDTPFQDEEEQAELHEEQEWQLSEEEKQELRQQLEAEIASLNAQIEEYAQERGGFETDWTDEQIKEYDEMIYSVQELGEQRRELMSEEEIQKENAEFHEWMEKEEAWLKDMYAIREELDEEES